jgi:hypothetical protein
MHPEQTIPENSNLHQCVRCQISSYRAETEHYDSWFVCRDCASVSSQSMSDMPLHLSASCGSSSALSCVVLSALKKPLARPEVASARISIRGWEPQGNPPS